MGFNSSTEVGVHVGLYLGNDGMDFITRYWIRQPRRTGKAFSLVRDSLRLAARPGLEKAIDPDALASSLGMPHYSLT